MPRLLLIVSTVLLALALPAVRASDDQAAFRDELIAHGLLLESGVPGLYGRGAIFEELRARFDRLALRRRDRWACCRRAAGRSPWRRCHLRRPT